MKTITCIDHTGSQCKQLPDDTLTSRLVVTVEPKREKSVASNDPFSMWFHQNGINARRQQQNPKKKQTKNKPSTKI